MPALTGPCLGRIMPKSGRLRHWERRAVSGRAVVSLAENCAARTEVKSALPCVFELGRLRDGLAVEGETVLASGDNDLLAILDTAGKDHFRERILHVFLDHAFQRTCTIGRIV